MKLHDIAKDFQDFQDVRQIINDSKIFEGLTVTTQDGKVTIDYDESSPVDDSWFKGVSSSVRGGDFMRTEPKKLNLFSKDDVAQEEIDELEQSGDMDAYQRNLFVFWGLPIFKADKEKGALFLDALKARNEEAVTMTDAAYDKILHNAAKTTVRDIKKRFRLAKYKNIYLLPYPSEKRVSNDFLEAVQQYFPSSAKTINVFSKAADMKRSPLLRSGDRQHKDPSFDDARKVVFRKELYLSVLAKYKKGVHDFDQVHNFYKSRREAANALTNNAKNPSDLRKAAADELKYLDDFEDKILEITPKSNSGTEEIKYDRGFVRRLTWDRVNVDSASFPEKRGKSLFIIVDDNLDTSKSMVDAYRKLFKAGMVRKPDDDVIGVVAHKLGVGRTLK